MSGAGSLADVERDPTQKAHLGVCRIFLLLGLFGLALMFAAATIPLLHQLFDLELLKYASGASVTIGTGGSIVKPVDLNQLLSNILRRPPP